MLCMARARRRYARPSGLDPLRVNRSHFARRSVAAACPHRAHRLERLEPYEGKLSSAVLRGGRAGNSPPPLDPQPAPFPIAKSVLPNPIADPGTGHRSPDASGQCPPGQNCCPGYRALVTTPRSSKENHPHTSPDRLTAAYLLGLIYGLTLCTCTVKGTSGNRMALHCLVGKARSSKTVRMRQMVTIPANQSRIASVFKKGFQRRRFNVAIAIHHIGFALMP